MLRNSALAAALVLPLPALVMTAGPVSAAPVTTEVVSGLAGPLQLAVGRDGSLYVGESFAGLLTKIDKHGTRTTLATGPGGGEVAGVDARGVGTVVFTTSSGVSETTSATSAGLWRALPNGRTSEVADLLAYESTHNPDSVNTYGVIAGAPSDACLAELGAFGITGDPYDGRLDTHPYAVATVPGGWVVADAAGNDLLEVSANGTVSTLAVLPPQPVEITKETAPGLDVPDCVGLTYAAEPVPTDVEVGPDGMLYVSTLAGGPASGSVYTIDPRTGAATLLASGFAGATNLAVAPDGTVYVAELFGDRISKIAAGSTSLVAELPSPAAVEWADGTLYASTGVFSPDVTMVTGSVVTIQP